mmetsp:Transcript_13858/g.30189  ORF Transcript_13858/g.30189 Transcript_13858/m.30189 type:complete len:423 (+) Transcript_13858:66-1334(+)
MSSLSLPQPPLSEGDAHKVPYRYVPYDVLETNWLGDPRRLQSSIKNEAAPDSGNISNNSNGKTDENNARYAPGALVWVLLSKGKPKQPNKTAQSGYNALALHKKRRDKKNKRKFNNASNTNESQSPTKDEQAVNNDENIKSNDSEQKNITNYETTLNHSRKEFFRRARVISDDEEISVEGGDTSSIQKLSERRVLVRYSLGATYRVRAYNLIPVLEPSVHNTILDALPSPKSNEDAQLQTPISLPPLVVIVPETNIYRRVAKVHTTPDDSFMEIGCDYGITVDKIHKSLEEAGDVPKVWPIEEKNSGNDDTLDKNEEGGGGERVHCLGIDRSKESIDIANERYPKCKFALGNVLIPDEMASVRTLCEQSLVGSAPSIICIDINGNREIAGVLECVTMVMKEKWKKQPRMIIVKSRFLYWELK